MISRNRFYVSKGIEKYFSGKIAERFRILRREKGSQKRRRTYWFINQSKLPWSSATSIDQYSIVPNASFSIHENVVLIYFLCKTPIRFLWGNCSITLIKKDLSILV